MYKEPVSIILTDYIVKIYISMQSDFVIEDSKIIDLQQQMNSKPYPKDLIEVLGELVLNNKIEILDKNNNMLLLSEIIQ